MLPDGVEEFLPPDTWAAEDLRRELLDAYRQAGYELVYTPIVEHLSTLLAGSGSDLEEQTFRFVDPASGRMLGLRADMTPQAARIAARRYRSAAQVRLCYLGTVLRASPEAPGGPRAVRQTGCELFGVEGIEGDIEVLELMLRTLAIADVRPLHLDLGHAGIYRGLVDALSLPLEHEQRLFGILQRKSVPDLREFARLRGLGAIERSLLEALPGLSGDLEVLAQARERLSAAPQPCRDALEELAEIAARMARRHPDIEIHIDLSELRGFRYHTGVLFAAYVPGHGRELARGGRYDGIGQEYGRAMPATGFSADINELLRYGRGVNRNGS